MIDASRRQMRFQVYTLANDTAIAVVLEEEEGQTFLVRIVYYPKDAPPETRVVERDLPTWQMAAMSAARACLDLENGVDFFAPQEG